MPSGGRRAGAGGKRPKKPRELKIIEGSFRKDRDGDTPPVVGGFPPEPEDLTDLERRAWASLPKAPWIGETDAQTVRAAVTVYARILRVQEQMRTTPDASNPLTFKHTTTSDGSERVEAKANPLYTLELQLWGRLMAILSELGLTPAARGKVSVPQVNADEDAWAKILG